MPIDGASTRIVGIMPPGYDVHDQRVQVWLPLTLDPANPGGRGGHFLYLVGRFRDDTSLAQARVDLESMLVKWPQRTEGNHVPNQKQHRLRFDGLQDDLVGGLRTALLGAAGRGRLRAAHRLCQPGQPDARARRVAATRVRHPLGARRRALAAAAAVPDRRHRPGSRRRRRSAQHSGLAGSARCWPPTPRACPGLAEIALDPVVLVFTLLVSLLTGSALRLVAAAAPAPARGQQFAQGSRTAIDGVAPRAPGCGAGS